jgi:hypothetical protein
MSKLQAIQVDENTVIYVEAAEDIAASEVAEAAQGRVGKGVGSGRMIEAQMTYSFKAIESTIRTYTKYMLNAFKDAALADVGKVTLEFGMNISGSGGVPYIAAGTVGCNIKVAVECVFPKQQTAQPPAAQVPAQLPNPVQPELPLRQHPPVSVYPSDYSSASQTGSGNGNGLETR